MKIKFLPQGIEVDATPEKTLLQIALENQIPVRSICKGKLTCAECRVKIVGGESNCLPPSAAELGLIGSAWRLDSQRFACQVRCFGDVVVDMTEQIQRDESARKKIRGVKTNLAPSESRAVVDTMILTEKIEPGATPEPSPRSEASAPRGERAERPEKGEGGGSGGGGNRRKRSRNRNRRPGGGPKTPTKA